jgi:hypothetical protein
MSENEMTGEGLERAFGAGTLDEGSVSQGSRSFEAFVRKSDDKGHVGVAVADSGSFVDVPVELIAMAEKTDYVAWGGHGHPQMLITLAESGDPITEVLHQLLDSLIGGNSPTGLPHHHAPNFTARGQVPMGAPDIGPRLADVLGAQTRGPQSPLARQQEWLRRGRLDGSKSRALTWASALAGLTITSPADHAINKSTWRSTFNWNGS